MQIYTNINETYIAGPTFLTIGNFDGLHRGHAALLRQLQQLAAQAARRRSPKSTNRPDYV